MTPDKEIIQKNEEAIEILQSLLFVKDALHPVFFNSDRQLKKEIRKKLLDISKFVTHYINETFQNVIIEDIWLIGSITSYIYHNKSDIDVFIVVKPDRAILSPDQFEKIYRYLPSSIAAMRVKPTIENISVDFGFITDDREDAADGTYSILYDSWVKPPQTRKFNFSFEQFYDCSCQMDIRINSFMQSLPKDSNDMISYQGCDEAAAFLSKLYREYRKNKWEKPDKDYDINYMAYKAIKRLGRIAQVKDYIDACISYNFNNGKIYDAGK